MCERRTKPPPGLTILERKESNEGGRVGQKYTCVYENDMKKTRIKSIKTTFYPTNIYVKNCFSKIDYLQKNLK